MTKHTIKIDPQNFVGDYLILEDTVSPGTKDPTTGKTLWDTNKVYGTTTAHLAEGRYALHVGGGIGGTHFWFEVNSSGIVPTATIVNPHSSSAPARSGDSSTLTLENVNVWIDPSRFTGRFKSNLTRDTEHDGSKGKIGPLVAIPGILFTVLNQSNGSQYDPALVGAYLHYQGDNAEVNLDSAAKGIKDGIRLRTAEIRLTPDRDSSFKVPGYGEIDQPCSLEVIAGLSLTISSISPSGTSVLRFTPTTGRP